MTITLKNIPPRLHRELKRRAVLHRRSLNSEVLSCLEETTSSRPVDKPALLEEIRKARAAFKFYLTDAELTQFKNEGRT